MTLTFFNFLVSTGKIPGLFYIYQFMLSVSNVQEVEVRQQGTVTSFYNLCLHVFM